MLRIVMGVFGPALFSSAQVCLAPSIWRRLLMHAFCCAFKRARTKLGMAMVASNPMMATTIMISTSVKPAARECLLFIRFIFLPWREQGAGGLLIYCHIVVHKLLVTSHGLTRRFLPAQES